MIKKTLYYAYCWSDGQIGFGKTIPEGALEITNHTNAKRLKETITCHASDDGKFIVSLRLAYLKITDSDPVDCLINFRQYINRILKTNLN